MKKSGIYCIRNMVNGKRYIGQSISLSRRMKTHIILLRAGKHHNEHLQNAYVKYGLDQFEMSVLEFVDGPMLDIREIAWMEYFNSTNPGFGYNLQTGGSVGRTVSDETKTKISVRGIGRIISEETRKRISLSNMGHPCSDETKQKIRIAKIGRKLSESAKKKMSETRRGKIHSTETKLKMSLAAMGHPCSDETRKKLIEASTGHVRSKESIAKQSETAKRKRELRSQEGAIANA